MLHNCILEFIGTMILVLMGDGVCAACSLKKSKAEGAGWVVIALGWGFAVMCGVFVAHDSGAHLNPAITLGLATAGQFPWGQVVPYIIAQMLGGFAGAILMYLFYYEHFKVTPDQATKLGVFCTAPAIKSNWNNLFCEALATFVLMFGVMCFGTYGAATAVVNIGADSALPVTMLIMSIGMSLGATTGYAMNAARDIAPRFAHWILPIPDKGDSQWGYAWVPLCGPILGAIVAALLFNLVY